MRPQTIKSNTLQKLICFCLLALTPLLSSAQTEKFIEGQHYSVIEQPLATSTGDNIEVKELFWYGCPHCFRLEPDIIHWKNNMKADDAQFVLVPAVFSQRWEFHAKAFYTLDALGILDTAHQAIFDSIHVNKKHINNLKQLTKILVEQFGQDEKKVESAFNSFSVDSNLRAARSISQKSGATGVPAIIVAGKYRTSVSEAQGQKQLLEVINFLVDKARTEKG
ncbi:MAG: thiol:disulfide interchange protein DsbA/DsbL [Arenicella sp.]